MLYSLFYHALECLVILMFLESLYQVEFKILVYSWTMFSRDSLLDISVISIFSKVVVSSVTNFSSFSLFLIMVCHLPWINSSLINILTINRAWSEEYQESGKIKWLLTLTESGQRNIRSITKLFKFWQDSGSLYRN